MPDVAIYRGMYFEGQEQSWMLWEVFGWKGAGAGSCLLEEEVVHEAMIDSTLIDE